MSKVKMQKKLFATITGHLSPQAVIVLKLLLRDGKLTRMTAMHYGIANVTARIAELRGVLSSWGYSLDCSNKVDAENRRYGEWTIYDVALSAPAPVRGVSGLPNLKLAA